MKFPVILALLEEFCSQNFIITSQTSPEDSHAPSCSSLMTQICGERSIFLFKQMLKYL